jgi:hypothetical protein
MEAHQDVMNLWRDPLQLAEIMWPGVRFYDKQREILQSVVDNDETVVVAGHMLGV